MEQNFNGKRLFLARIEKKLSRRELGEKIGVATSAIQAYEMNRTQPKLGRIKEIATAVGLNVEDLILPLSQYNTINGNNNAPIVSGNSGVINHNTACNCKLEQIEKAILEMENIDPKIAMQILKIIKTYKD